MAKTLLSRSTPLNLTLHLSHIKQLQCHVITTGLFSLPVSPSRSKLLELTSLTSHLPFALHTFRHIPTPSTNDWNAILRGFIPSPNPLNAFLWFKSLLVSTWDRFVLPDALTCSFVFKALTRVLALKEGQQMHSYVFRTGFLVDALLATTILDLYAKVGDLDSAEKVFDEMGVRDIASWNAFISGLANGNRPNEALGLFDKMREFGFRPNGITVLGALSACSQLGAIKQGERIYEYVREEKLDVSNEIVCNAVIDMYAKCGFVDKAYLVFENMKCRRTLITWNTMLMGFAMHGDASKALELFERMRDEDDVRPNDVAYLAVLCACNHGGFVEEGFRLFNSMEKYGVVPNIKHYGSVVDLLGRAGWLREAYNIIKSMPVAPDTVLWQILLGACRNYGNLEMAEMVSQKLVEMGSNSDGNFVLMSNVYASCERWVDVGRVRDAMKNQDVKKVPGVSYIEEKGVVHMFYNGDTGHENWREIYAKLDEIKYRIKEFGYVEETSLVLHDIGEEEKENVLYHHSEKLALAFGLISTNEGTPIQVIKNLRICQDCHVVIKLISKLYDREIIIRDLVRFHRFKDGYCSCRDYW